MPTQILSDNMELTPSMKVLAEDKLKVLLTHVEERSAQEAMIRIVMNKAQEPEQFLVKLEAIIDGKTYFADEVDFTMQTAMVNAVDEVDKQYLKDKEKQNNRDYQKNRELKRFDPETESPDKDSGDLGA